MDSLEDAARNAANRWKERSTAKDDIRKITMELLETKTMTEVANIMGVSRTSLYYFLYGRDGKIKSSRRAHVLGLSTPIEHRDDRESA